MVKEVDPTKVVAEGEEEEENMGREAGAEMIIEEDMAEMGEAMPTERKEEVVIGSLIFKVK
jgi:hypothetical protein